MGDGERGRGLAVDTLEIERTWDRLAPGYDRMERPLDTLLVARRRRALLRLARGETLEVAAGTGRNLAHYPRGRPLRLTLTDLSAGMLAVARGRAHARPPRARQASALAGGAPRGRRP